MSASRHRNQRLLEAKQLLEAFIRLIAGAIERQEPYAEATASACPS